MKLPKDDKRTPQQAVNCALSQVSRIMRLSDKQAKRALIVLHEWSDIDEETINGALNQAEEEETP